MLRERIEGKWIEAFAAVFRRCDVTAGHEVAILSETQSRPVTVALAELALLSLGARPFHVVVPTPPQRAGVPIRSTGASDALQGSKPVVTALGQSAMVVDCTVEGLLHAPELPQILGAGARVLMISNEHPEALERLRAHRRPRGQGEGGNPPAARRRSGCTSPRPRARTSHVSLEGAAVGRRLGLYDAAGHHHALARRALPLLSRARQRRRPPRDGARRRQPHVQALSGDRPSTLTIRDDYVVDIAGDGLDAELMRSYFAAWGDKDAYAVSHVGWGMNPGARWDAMTMYDKNDFNGTELRAFAGNFLYSTGANEVAGRRRSATSTCRCAAARCASTARPSSRTACSKASSRERVARLAQLVPIPNPLPSPAAAARSSRPGPAIGSSSVLRAWTRR